MNNEELQKKIENILESLQGAGVDNWSGYDYAMEMMKEME